MADEIDFAEDLVTAERDAGIARVRVQMAAQGAEECEDCGQDIPAARRAAVPFAVRCAGCQAVFEGVGRRG